jgi:predicted MFS family arabinose efflux permease
LAIGRGAKNSPHSAIYWGLPITSERYPPFWRATTSGFCATLVGVGLGRFAYTPLIPALIGAGWFTPSQTYYLQTANFAGYLAGALLYRPLTKRFSRVAVLRLMMLLASVALFACAVPISFWWFALWRTASGLSGAVLLVVAPAEVLPHVPQRKAGFAGGVIFAGVAVGIAASGTVVPFLLRLDLSTTWIALAGFALLLTAIAWNGWPADRQPDQERAHRASPTTPKPASSPRLAGLYVEYALAAMALVPHMVFIVDFVARGLGKGLEIGSLYWTVFGLSAIGGSLLMGWLGDRVGFRRALRLVFMIETLAVLLPALVQTTLSLLVSTSFVGAFVTGSSTLVIGRIGELLRGSGKPQGMAWSIATVAFALGQTLAAFTLSWLFAATGRYVVLFACGAAALGLSLIIDLVTSRLAHQYS